MKTAIDRPRPSIPRLILGFALAPLVPAVLYGLTVSASTGMDAGGFLDFVGVGLLFFGYPATLLLGVPVYFVLRRHLEPRPANFALVAGAVAGLPLLSATFFVLGVIGGFVFWLCTTWRNSDAARAPDEESRTSASAPRA